jgi:lipoprotein NlpD
LPPGAGVFAAAAGRVVYSGNGLAGFRYLTIIKHDDEFLSAYSLNEKPLVAEGATVRAGTPVAGAGQRGRQTLHFEIRREGEPIDPARVIR